MRVSHVADGPFAALQVDDTLADAAREMESNSLAAVAVCEGGVLVGIATERDLVRAASDGAPFDLTTLDDYMTASPVTLPADADPDHALRLMLDGGFRHIPLLDSDEDVVGMVTMRQLIRALLAAKAPA
jgi:CBS domain-containing protein